MKIGINGSGMVQKASVQAITDHVLLLRIRDSPIIGLPSTQQVGSMHSLHSPWSDKQLLQSNSAQLLCQLFRATR